MAVKIISSSVYPAEIIHSSIELAARAGNKCIDDSGVKKKNVGMLIHTGIYRDKNVVEPALACLIQKNMGLNTDPVNKNLSNRTFAFDLFNSELGFLYAAQTADGFINSGRADYVLITSSDVHPSQDVVPEYPFSHVGAAALLAKPDDTKTGFQHYYFKTATKGSPGYYGYAAIYEYGVEGRKSIIVNFDKDFENRSLDFAISAVKEFSEAKKVNIADVKFVITSQFYKDFGKKLAKEIGLGENNAIDIYDKYGNPHTSTLIAGYNFLKQSGFMLPGDKILFVGVGSGLMAGVGLYVA
jgi:3-oxoacyl-[acyl-carrier-protein] synthase-3